MENINNITVAVTQSQSNKTINTAINNIRKNGVAWNNLVHETICNIMYHAMTYNDCTAAERLLNAMPKSAKRSLVCLHFERYSPIHVRIEKNAYKASYHTPEAKRYNPFNIEAAKANPWFDMPEADKEVIYFTSASVLSRLHAIVSSANTAIKDNKVVANDVDKMLASINAVKSLITSIENKAFVPADTIEDDFNLEDGFAPAALKAA